MWPWLLLLLSISVHNTIAPGLWDYVSLQFEVAMVVLSIPIILWLRKQTSLLFAILCFFVTARMSHTVFAAINTFSVGPIEYRATISMLSASSYISAVVLLLSPLVLGLDTLKKLTPAVAIYGALNSLYVIAGALSQIPKHYLGPQNEWAESIRFNKFAMGVGISGFLDYAGMNGCLIAICSVPLIGYALIKKHRVIAVTGMVLNIIAIILSSSSIPYGVLAVSVAAYFVCGKRITLKSALATLGIILVPTIVGLLSQGAQLFDSAKRFTAYKIFMATWWHSKFVWLGTGPGTFAGISKEIQAHTKFDVLENGSMFVWRWLHSDVLQVFFEWGLVGGIIFLLVLIQVTRKLYAQNNPTVFAIGAGLFATAIFNYPARYSPTAFLIAFVIIYAYKASLEIDAQQKTVELEKKEQAKKPELALHCQQSL